MLFYFTILFHIPSVDQSCPKVGYVDKNVVKYTLFKLYFTLKFLEELIDYYITLFTPLLVLMVSKAALHNSLICSYAIL